MNGVEDIDMVDEGPEKVKTGSHKEGEEEMTVVVPPPKSSKLAPDGTNDQEDTAMEGVESDDKATESEVIDEKAKAVTGSYSSSEST